MNPFVFRKHGVPVRASAAGLEENLAAEIDAAMAAMDAATISLDDETPGSDSLPEHEIKTQPSNNIQNGMEVDLGSASNADSITTGSLESISTATEVTQGRGRGGRGRGWGRGWGRQGAAK